MLVTLLGIVMEVRPEQLEKAELPMLVTLLGMVIEVSPGHHEKAPPATPKVPSFIVMEVFSGIIPLYLYATFPA